LAAPEIGDVAAAAILVVDDNAGNRDMLGHRLEPVMDFGRSR
jgi:hypothetical protein